MGRKAVQETIFSERRIYEKTVSVTDCRSYTFPGLQQSVKELLKPFGGLEYFFSSGARVLIKPNLLAAASPEEAVTTHPALVKALVVAAQEAGAKVYLGDSPIRGSLEEVARTAGMEELLRETGTLLLPFKKIKNISFPKGRKCQEFPLAAEALEMDFIINVGKLKTHSLTGLTAAVKNCYGLLVDKHKMRYHARYPSVHDFADMLLDLYLAVKPGFSVMDAVVAMEGHGPRKGTPKAVGALLASPNAVALDAAIAQLAGYSTHEVSTLQAASRRGLPGYDLGELEIEGPLETLRRTDFDKGPSTGGWSFLWRFAPSWLRNTQQRRRPWPVVGEECNLCRACLEYCPVGVMYVADEMQQKDNLGKKESVKIQHEKCLRCYCCHEICPRGAIKLQAGLPR